MGLNKKVGLTAGGVVAILAVIGVKAYTRYERSDEKREVDKIVAQNEQDHAARMQRLEEMRAKIAPMKTGLKACDTLMGLQRKPPTCRDARTSGEITSMIDKTMEKALKEASSAAALETSCQATLDKILELAVDHGCKLD